MYIIYVIPSENQFANYWNPVITGIQEKKKKRAESLLKEIMNENFPNLGRYLYILDHDAHR